MCTRSPTYLSPPPFPNTKSQSKTFVWLWCNKPPPTSSWDEAAENVCGNVTIGCKSCANFLNQSQNLVKQFSDTFGTQL